MILDHKCPIHGYRLIHLPRELVTTYGDIRFKCPLRSCSYDIERFVTTAEGDMHRRGSIIELQQEIRPQ